MNRAATEVPPEASEYVIRALEGGISRPEQEEAALVAAVTAGS